MKYIGKESVKSESGRARDKGQLRDFVGSTIGNHISIQNCNNICSCCLILQSKYKLIVLLLIFSLLLLLINYLYLLGSIGGTIETLFLTTESNQNNSVSKSHFAVGN